MLVLTRKIGESIRIGEDIEVVVTAIDQNKVKIGIKSPPKIPIYREELYQKIQQDNREAAGMKTGDLDDLLELYAKEKYRGPLDGGRS
ncbi:MAG: carbon storage regulator CsrA [Syntrophobacteraceae bacterium]|nr:carbon storage regulator CsrA [Desulfobacteraceae bacterium]